MSYQVIIPQPVQKRINDFSEDLQVRLIAAIAVLSDNPRPNGVKKLKGYDSTYRVRVGDYRIIYQIQDRELIIILLSCIHRKDAYYCPIQMDEVRTLVSKK